MSRDSSIAYDVHLGAWTDWSRGPVLGATLTLTREDGNLLIAFLAFFVALVGTRFWRIVCLILHYTYSRGSPRDGVHHQRQVFLRNAPNPEVAVWTLADMGVSWRHKAEHVWSRLLPILGLALVCMVGFVLAGGFSPRLATILNGEVLLSGENCAYVRNDYNMSTYGDTIGPLLAETMIAAENYARQCYISASVSVSCGTYIKKQLTPVVVDTNASCPFDPKVCKSTYGNLFIDTGLLDSHFDFGRNTPTNRRIQWRRTVHCAPLATDGYRFRTHDEAKNQSYTTYYYGPLRNLNDSSTVNYTTQFLNNGYPDIEEYSSFIPIPELKPQNASLYLFFLTSDRILFTRASNDSWYGGTTNTVQIHKLKFSDWGNTTMFRQSEPGSPLACRQLEQSCFVGIKGQQRCTPLEGSANSIVDLYSLLDEEDEDWFFWLFRTTFHVSSETIGPIALLGTQALTAKSKLSGPLMGSLPDNQWQLEVQHWHATAMAHLQATFLESIIGYEDLAFAPLVRRPNKTAEYELCANQKVLAEGFISVSILGIACIFGGGVLVIVLSFASGPIFSWYLRRGGRDEYARLEWSTNDPFQLQRLAHEASGIGTWSGGAASVPVTQLGDCLGVLDVVDPTHPKLRRNFVNNVDEICELLENEDGSEERSEHV
ncbi:hypothetical protein GQ53DRAFT_670404 [Thozetella sp. PMI_491]|nr:hypothetical protein GQ53DRAFT_670404 [Thozetella sp. PMI_491]